VTVKCPSCRINFGLWLPKSQAPYVRTTRLADLCLPVEPGPISAAPLTLGRAELPVPWRKPDALALRPR
jgi:hypothetical protein